MKKELPVIIVPPSGNKSWYGGAYVLAFVYSKKNGNFLVKGWRSDVQEFLKKNYTHYFVQYTLWHRGYRRTIWEFWKDGIGMHRVLQLKGRKRHIVKNSFKVYKYLGPKLEFRRPLTRWIPELEIF